MSAINNKQVKNGKIELLRFIFCVYVLMFHIQKYLVGEPSLDRIDFAMFPHGAMGVEFFFLVSGFLMAKSIYKARKLNPGKENRFSPTEALGFMKRKYLSVFPQHIVAFVLTFIIYVACKEFSLLEIAIKAVESIPAMFLVQMSGINYTSPNHIEWYISCMLIAMAIVYPVCRKYYYSFTRFFVPLGSLLVIGYLIYTTKALTGVMTWVGICYKSLLRAIVEISLGTTAFELSRYLSKKEFSKKKKVILTVAEALCFAITTLYVLITFSKKYEVYILVLLFFLVVIAFSGVTYGSGFFNNRFFAFLGKISLPIYLTQLAAIYIVQYKITDLETPLRFALTIALNVIFTFVIMVAGNLISKKLIKR